MNKIAIAAVVVLVLVAVAALALYPRTPSSSPYSTTASSAYNNTGSNGGGYISNQSTVFTKLYTGKSATYYGQFSVMLDSISGTGSSAIAMINVSDGSGHYSVRSLGQMQYTGFGQNDGSPYVVVDQVNGSGGWITLNISSSAPQGFSMVGSGSQGSNQSSGQGGTSLNSGTRDQSLPACSKISFSYTPISEANFTTFAPLGWISAGGHVLPVNHGSFYLDTIGSSTANVSVVAPGNITVFEIVGQQYLNSNQPSDYAIYFSPCANVTFYLGHVQRLVPQLASNYTSLTGCQNSTASGTQLSVCQKQMNVKFSAGEKMGSVGGQLVMQNAVQAMDLGVYDYALPPLQFANQSRYGTDKLHAACPLNYFDSQIQNYLYNGKVGVTGVTRTAQPLCGTNMEDVAGTAQGNWFQKGSTAYGNEGLLIALINNPFTPGSQLFSIGLQANLTGLAGATYYFTPTGSGNINRNFANVTANGQVYCYDSFTDSYAGGSSAPGMMLVQLVDSNTLEIEYRGSGSCGSGPWSFTGNSAYFYR